MGARRLAQAPQFFLKNTNLKRSLFIRLCQVLVALRHVGSEMPDQRWNLGQALHCKADSNHWPPGKPQVPWLSWGPCRPGPGPTEDLQGWMFGPDRAAHGASLLPSESIAPPHRRRVSEDSDLQGRLKNPTTHLDAKAPRAGALDALCCSRVRMLRETPGAGWE